MTIFELVKVVLDELYQEGHQIYADELDAKILAQMSYLSQNYKKLKSRDRSPIDYKDPATRFAYVYKYVAAHGDYLVQVLEALRAEVGGNIFEGDTLRLSCIGGGPGSDIVGMLKYLADYTEEPTRRVTCYLLDGEQSWADTWTEIGDSLTSNLAVNVNFQQLDVTKPETWSAQKKFLKSDLFTLSYFVSEVYAFDDGKAFSFWQKLFDGASAGSMFVYVDNGENDFNRYFDKHWEGREDIECIICDNNVPKTPRYSEQAAELGEYRQKFNHSPKLRSLISFRLLRKQ